MRAICLGNSEGVWSSIVQYMPTETYFLSISFSSDHIEFCFFFPPYAQSLTFAFFISLFHLFLFIPNTTPSVCFQVEGWNEGFRVRSQTGTSASPPACSCEWPWEVGLADPWQCGLFWHWVILCPLQSSPNLTHSHTSYADHQHLYLFNISKSVWASLVPQWWGIHLSVLEMRVPSLGWEDALEKEMAIFLPGESQGQRSLGGYSPRGRKESDTTEQLKKTTAVLTALGEYRLGLWGLCTRWKTG